MRRMLAVGVFFVFGCGGSDGTILNPEGEIAHQRAGLMGDVSEAAKAVVVALK